MLWTEQGIINFKDTMKRAKAAESDTEKIGGKFTLYWIFGKYDGIGILEAPNEEAAMQFGLKVGSLGNIGTTKLRAFIEEEIVSVIDKLS
ncbi:MAG TPA: GYD domain-containing protein [Nitrososphaeraceae archaeon]|nr:GYD domain-containing protein [Nitrososphaeraceae archaeon]